MTDDAVMYSSMNEDPLESTIEINESSSEDETIAAVRLKSQNKVKEIVDLSRVNLSKPYYQVENGKIVPIKKSLLINLKIEKYIKKFKTKLPRKIIRNNELLNSGDDDRNLKLHKKHKTSRKPDALDRLMAQIDAQLTAQGLPVPKVSTIKNEAHLQSDFTNKSKSFKRINMKANTLECFSNSMTVNIVTPIDKKEKAKNDSIIEKVVDCCKSENDPYIEKLSNTDKINTMTPKKFNISNLNNSNDDFYWPDDLPDNDECSRDTIRDSVVPHQIPNDCCNSKKTECSKYEIMETNDGSFVQYKVYDKFEDYSSEQKTDEHLVTSALQIDLCKQIQNNGKQKIEQRNMWKNLKVFETYESFLISYERFLKLNKKCKNIFYEYDGIKLNPIIVNNINYTRSGKSLTLSENTIEEEQTDGCDITFGVQFLSKKLNDINNVEIEKRHHGIFDYGFKYERVNQNNERMITSYEILDPHGCELCGKTFRNKKTLKDHNKNVHLAQCDIRNERRSVRWNCETCLKTFKHLENFTEHQDKKHNQRKSFVSNCESESVADLHIANRHIENIPETTDQKSFKCEKCFETFHSYKCMKSHFRIQHPKTKKTYPFKCKLCKIGFKKLTALLRHTYSVHKVKILTKNTFISNKGNKDSFNSQLDIEQESLQSVDSKLVVANSTSILTKDCTVAGRRNKYDLLESQNETAVSKGRLERDPFRYQLNRITVTVEGGENLDLYKCGRCPKVFAIQKSLADHERRVHLKSNLNNPDYPFVCKPCKKGYRRSNDLMRHARLYHKVIIRNNRCIPKTINKALKNSGTRLNRNSVLKGEESSESIKRSLISKSVEDEQLCVIKNAWICDFCSKSYDTQKKWRDHRRRVHISRPIKLKAISTKPTSVNRNLLQDLFDEKLIAKNEYGKLLCRQCTESFDCFETFKIHFNNQHTESTINADSEYPYSCLKCRKVFTKSSEVIKHAKDVHEIFLKIFSDRQRQEYFCDSCPKQFHFKQSLRRHIESTHSKTIDPNEYIKCNDGCSKSFQSQAHLERHLRLYSHFRCVTCNMHFSNQGMLKKHQVCHTKERLYICPVCTKTYMQKHHLVQHELTHGDKKHKCPHCPIACFTGSQLNSHLRIHSGDRPFNCHFCPDTFKRAQALRQHERLHTGEKSTYRCSSCDRSFRSSNGLARHERSHRIGRILSRISQDHASPLNALHQTDTVENAANHCGTNLETEVQRNILAVQEAGSLLQSKINILELR